MPAMATTLTYAGTRGNTVEFALSGHTVQDPKLLACTMTNSNSPTGNAIGSFKFIKGTHDADGALIPSRVTAEAVVKFPKHGDMADVTPMFALLGDVVQSDEFIKFVTKHLPPAP